MSAFDASAIESLDFDFTGIPRAGAPSGETCSAKGIVPEPSTEQIGAFLGYFGDERQRLLDLAAKAKAGDDISADRPDLVAKFNELRGVIADFCSGCPSRAEIDELPPRALSAFVRWLLEEFAPKG